MMLDQYLDKYLKVMTCGASDLTREDKIRSGRYFDQHESDRSNVLLYCSE